MQVRFYGSLLGINQGGYTSFSSGSKTKKVTYPVAFTTVDPVALPIDGTNNETVYKLGYSGRTTSEVTFVSEATSTGAFSWLAIGY